MEYSDDSVAKMAKTNTARCCFRCGSTLHIIRNCHSKKGKKSQTSIMVILLTCRKAKLFISFEPVDKQCVSLAHGVTAAVTCKETVFLARLKRALEMICVPSLKYNLLSEYFN